MKENFEFYDNQAVLTTNGVMPNSNEELVTGHVFKKIVSMFIASLVERDSPLLDIFGAPYTSERFGEICSLLGLLTTKAREQILEEHPQYTCFFSEVYNLNQFVEELYNFWRHYERFLVLYSSTDDVELQHHKKPYRAFNATVEQLNHLVRGTYRDICENITGTHPKVYRQVPAGFQIGLIAKRMGGTYPEEYQFLENSYCIRQVLVEPPLIIDPPINKRDGEFSAVREILSAGLGLTRRNGYASQRGLGS